MPRPRRNPGNPYGLRLNPLGVTRLNALAKRARAAAPADEDLRPSLRKKVDSQPLAIAEPARRARTARESKGEARTLTKIGEREGTGDGISLRSSDTKPRERLLFSPLEDEPAIDNLPEPIPLTPRTTRGASGGGRARSATPVIDQGLVVVLLDPRRRLLDEYGGTPAAMMLDDDANRPRRRRLPGFHSDQRVDRQHGVD